jgi:hypothetical protein
MIAQAVEQKIAEAISGSDAIFQPFFQRKDIADAIRRMQTVSEQQKWGHYFEKWGCLVCGTKDTIHGSVGMCENCHHLVFLRLQTILRKHAPPTDQALPTFVDTVRLAREALGPALKALPAKGRKSGKVSPNGG